MAPYVLSADGSQSKFQPAEIAYLDITRQLACFVNCQLSTLRGNAPFWHDAPCQWHVGWHVRAMSTFAPGERKRRKLFNSPLFRGRNISGYLGSSRMNYTRCDAPGPHDKSPRLFSLSLIMAIRFDHTVLIRQPYL
jgi:hypothetical protein